MKVLRGISLLLFALCVSMAASAFSFVNETLTYKVMYKWGLIHKQAGRAEFKVTSGPGGNVTAHMYARTEPWADHIYTVRDTLISTFNPYTCLPTLYKRIAHEGKQYAYDKVAFSRSGNVSSAECTRLRRKKEKDPANKTSTSLKATGDAVDLLSSFYYLRNLKFSGMQKGESKTINIFSGKRKEILKITYNGTEEIKLDKKKYTTYYVTFTFTSDSGKSTSKPIKAWLTTDARHIPLKLVGELPIGHVECLYTGKI
ncbi:MAG: DUF3108 domain-containing protein [Bacteroides sp.]|nr:DUF3108 domain-containing protein [Bacteroides sp.]